MAKFLLMGPVTRDTNLKSGSTCKGIGGPVYYQAGVLSSLKSDVTALVTLGKDDANLLTYFSKDTQLKPVWGGETMQFENFYPDEDPNHRVQRACIPSNPLEVSHLDFLELETFNAALISPLSPEDIPLETIKHIFKSGTPVYLGVQGYLRHLEGQNVVLKPWKQYKNFLKYVNFLFMDEVEARVITGNSSMSLLEISRDISLLGPEEVIITRGDQGSLIYSRHHDKSYSIPAYPPQERVDPTGLGDSYLAAYAFRKQETSDPEECGIFSSIVSSLKLEKKGAFQGNINIINQRIQELKL
ncbi:MULTISPECIES: PfkB family carbohydrate kinase [Methanobacterium]|jgi:sugar/nucleoside kinase (ribokinase family)|uniref:Carbohydrate kinase n=1 Tax=Methanobacterium formicicum TaxID=2162 RepID=A0A090I5E5_METFO|nr:MULTISPECIES: PfkB family carbohydrate kinase [Methanobacterium]KUK72404.1 MAG: Sugar kinase, ribokinase [Methanobacterium sp. 42_16]MBF4474109.1 carbohydrate kinase [Methanobacterium formicicum]MDG3546369.1 PfkB family carbohydrate kinase [Methanobacterium formicicum]MDH2659681.1 PfkB family carbohydrate kinase [Methanobacterium formicicum]CEA14729.1 PfkB domain-containing protein [Methanobacterium formicicum]